VAQIFNLPYRRLAVGWAPDSPERSGLAASSQISKSAIQQSATLRYADGDHRQLADALEGLSSRCPSLTGMVTGA
jgi:hypothetical protein